MFIAELERELMVASAECENALHYGRILNEWADGAGVDLSTGATSQDESTVIICHCSVSGRKVATWSVS